MSLKRRVLNVERVFGRPMEVTWQEAYAASDRIDARLVAKLNAMAEGRESPFEDPALVERDAEVLVRWPKQRGIQEPDPNESEARLREYLRRLEQALRHSP